jgi:hypothetical protein
MPNDRKSGPRRFASSVDISNLVRAHGVTRNQARRLINKFGNNSRRQARPRFNQTVIGRRACAAAGSLRRSSALAPALAAAEVSDRRFRRVYRTTAIGLTKVSRVLALARSMRSR